jgi:hypothetical protein
MSFPRALAIALLTCAALASCENHPTNAIAGSNAATIRVVNATSQRLDVVTSGVVSAGNGNLGFGAASACFRFDPADPDFFVRVTGTTASLPYTPTGTIVGGNYTAVVSTNVGTIQFATVQWGFSPTTGQSGLRIFDAVPLLGSFDAYVTPSTSTQPSLVFRNIAYGVATPFVETPPGNTLVQLTTAGTLEIVFDAGVQSLAAGQSYMLVSAIPSSFLTTAC